jgi:hypothetical protein
MPRHSSHRRHRSSDRETRWIERSALVALTLIGLFVLVDFCSRSPAGRMVLVGLAIFTALVAVVTVSCLVGRCVAGVRNACALQMGRRSLEKAMHAQRSLRRVT